MKWFDDLPLRAKLMVNFVFSGGLPSEGNAFSFMLLNFLLKFCIVFTQDGERINGLFIINNKTKVVPDKIFIENPYNLTMIT